MRLGAHRVDARVRAAPAGDLPARVYRPNGMGLFPVLVYFHGGGWVILIGSPTCVCATLFAVTARRSGPSAPQSGATKAFVLVWLYG